MGQDRILKWRGFLIGIGAIIFFAVATMLGYAGDQTPEFYRVKIEELGKRVFFDNISVPKRMSCATCHDPTAGWTFKNSGVNLHQVAVTGADPHRAGTLKPPSNAYASKTGEFRQCNLGAFPPAQRFCGGNFWNGRSEGRVQAIPPEFPGAAGHVDEEIFENITPERIVVYENFLGPVADQALNPMPNPVEQNIEIRAVCEHVKASKYAPLFKIVWGEAINCKDEVYGTKGFKAYEINFRRIALALAAWQASREVNSFSSKRDMALQRELDGIDVDDTPGEFPLVGLTAQENYGHDLFYATRFRPLNVNGVRKFSNCAFCHSDNPVVPGNPSPDTGAEPEQSYADDAYHNIGTPPNPEIPGYPVPNAGLAGHTGIAAHTGSHKTPTLRNVDKRPGKGFTKAYTHNGWFKSMESIVHFYNTAFIGGATANAFEVTRCDPNFTWTEKEALAHNCWPAQEQPGGAIPFLVGDLGLTAEDEAAIVAYLRTLSDTYTPKQPAPYK